MHFPGLGGNAVSHVSSFWKRSGLKVSSGPGSKPYFIGFCLLPLSKELYSHMGRQAAFPDSHVSLPSHISLCFICKLEFSLLSYTIFSSFSVSHLPSLPLLSSLIPLMLSASYSSSFLAGSQGNSGEASII